MAINLHEKAYTKIVDAYTHESFLAGRAKAEFKMEGINTLKIYNIITQEPVNYDLTRGNGSSRFGNLNELQDTYQELTMTQNKAFNIGIDKTYNVDQNMMKKAGHVLQEQINEKIVPMTDKYVLGKWFKDAGYTVTLANAGTNVTGKNLISGLVAIETHFNNTFVATGDRYCAIRFSDLALLRETDRWNNVEKMTEKYLVNGDIDKFGTLKVFGMPDTWFPEHTRMLAFQSKAVLAPMKIKTARIITDSENIDGDILQGHYYYDAFVVGRRCDGVVAVVDSGYKATNPTITVGDSTTTITATGATTIYYTTDGSDPRYSATRTAYTAAISAKTNIKAVAYATGKYVSDLIAV